MRRQWRKYFARMVCACSVEERADHLVLADVWGSLGVSGKEAEDLLNTVGITLNKNAIANDTQKPFDPSGIRFGTPAITTRNFSAEDCKEVARIMIDVLKRKEEALAKAKAKITHLAETYPVPASFI